MIEYEGLKANTVIFGNGRDFKPVVTDAPPDAIDDEMAPLFKAAGRGDIGLIMLTQDGFPLPPLSSERYPLVLVVGDDPIGFSKGPSGFPGELAEYIRASSGVIVYSGLGAGAAYETAVKLAMKGGHPVVLIQTQVEKHERWVSFVKKAEPQMPIMEIHPDRGFGSIEAPAMYRQQRRASTRKERKTR